MNILSICYESICIQIAKIEFNNYIKELNRGKKLKEKHLTIHLLKKNLEVDEKYTFDGERYNRLIEKSRRILSEKEYEIFKYICNHHYAVELMDIAFNIGISSIASVRTYISRISKKLREKFTKDELEELLELTSIYVLGRK